MIGRIVHGGSLLQLAQKTNGGLPVLTSCDRLRVVNASPTRRPAVQPPVWIAPEERALLETAGTTAHRLATGSEGWVERLGDDAMISHKNDAALETLLAGLEKWSATAGWIPARIFTRFLPLKNDERISPILHSGDATLPLTTVVTEEGIRYALDFAAGYSHGLFLDQRMNRAKVRALRPKRMLNTFAYTCGFSVCASLAGARTTSLDLSKKYLEWGKRNFALNGLDPAQHDFIYGDTFDWMRRLSKKGRAFDAIILDPPTFSQSKESGIFRAEKDYGKLVTAALPLLKPNGVLFASTNAAYLLPEKFLDQIAEAVRSARRKILQQHYVPQPPDFPISRDEPAYLKTVWLRVG